MKRPKRARGARRNPAPAPRPKRSIIPLAVVLILAGGLALWWWRATSRESHQASPRIDPRQAYREAMDLTQQRRFIESLPLLRAAMESDTGVSQLHHDYATAMLNAVHQGRQHLGHQEFAVRSSIERIEMVRWALVELVAAERTAHDPRAHAWAIRTRAQALGAWGFPWEAMAGYRQVEGADPSWTEIMGRAERVLFEMEHPELGNERR